MTAGAKVLTTVLAALGGCLIVVGTVYFFVGPTDLPDFMPGHDRLSLRHRRRGAFLGLVGLISLGLAALTVYRSRDQFPRGDDPVT